VSTTGGSGTPAPPVAPVERQVGPISRTDIVKFAGAGGDFNPIHHDEEFAKRAGFPSVFAMGMFTAGLLGDFVETWLGIERIRGLSVRFVAPTWPNDVLTFGAGRPSVTDGRMAATLRVTAGDDARLSGEVVIADDGSSDTTSPETPPELRSLLERLDDTVTLPIERGKVMEFARAIKSDNALHFDPAVARDAGFADVVAPLTFSAAVALYNGGDAADVPKQLDLDLPRMVHGEQRWTFHRPAVAGDTLIGSRRATAAWRKPTKSGGVMTFVCVTTDYKDEAGQPVLRDEMVMIERPPQPTKQ